MANDPVCGMQVDEKKAAAIAQYKSRTYCFCSPACQAKSDRNPEQFGKPS
ncbi:MAG TPA: YHS domain-containing protein [Nitrospiria bacterium]|nr:YHS domain-containing protein [Nitrospiria bacterium]